MSYWTPSGSKILLDSSRVLTLPSGQVVGVALVVNTGANQVSLKVGGTLYTLPALSSVFAPFSNLSVFNSSDLTNVYAQPGYATDDSKISVISFDVLSLKPTMWLKMNEGSGSTLNDSSGNGNTGTLAGAVSWINGYLNFNGTTNIVTVPGLLGSPTKCTICAWGNSQTFGGFLARINQSPGIFGGQGTYFNGSSFPAIGTGVSKGSHHYTYVCDPANSLQALYVDGTLNATGTDANAISYNTGGSGNTEIGASGPVVANQFTGTIHDVLVIPTALTASQINSVRLATA